MKKVQDNIDNDVDKSSKQVLMDFKAINKSKKQKSKRIWEIDFLRGFCILLMILDHTMFDFMFLPDFAIDFKSIDIGFLQKFINAFIQGTKTPFFIDASNLGEWYWTWSVRINIRWVVVTLFLTLSGMSCIFSRSNTKRLIKMCIASLVLTIATVILEQVFNMTGMIIVFGILHIMSLSLLIYMALKKIFNNNKWIYLIFGLLFFIGGICIKFWDLPPNKYSDTLDFNMIVKVLVGLRDYGADSYGILPYTGFYLIGAFLGEVLYKKKKTLLPILDKAWQKPVSFVGRNAIWVYLGHQVLVFITIVLAVTITGFSVI